MCKVLNILLITLAILRLDQEVTAETAAVRKPNFDILFVKDFGHHMQSHPDLNLTALNYNPKERLFTLGNKYDNTLFNLEYKLEGFMQNSFVYNGSYTYPEDVLLDIQYLELSYKNSWYDGQVFLKAGGIGQSYVSLVARAGATKDLNLLCNVKVNGDIYEVIN